MYRFVNFKGFADATLDLRTPVTILIGRNGAGKSNVVEALELVSALLHGDSTDGVGEPSARPRIPIRGGLKQCVRRGATGFEIHVAVQDDLRYCLKMEERETLGARGRSRLTTFETLSYGQTTIATDVNDIGRRTVQLDGKSLMGIDDRSWFAAGSNVLANAGPDCAAAAQSVAKSAGQVSVVQPDPTAMRAFVPLDDAMLHRNADNLASCLYALETGTQRQRAAHRQIVQVLRTVPEEPIGALAAVDVEGRLVSFRVVYDNGEWALANVLSDGTLHLLGVAAALETMPEDSVVVFEEVDRGLHPSKVHELLAFCTAVARERHLRVLITTHNPATLDALTQEQRQGVVVCHWDAAAKASLLTPLHELHDYLSVLTASSLGAAASAGVIDEAARVPTAEEDAAKMAQALTWIDNLRGQEEP
jgi:predicted ATPase